MPGASSRAGRAVSRPRRAFAIVKSVLNQIATADPLADQVFQALGDPNRRIIVERLSRGPASVSELAKPLTMSLPGVLQHVQALEASGLVRSEKVGRVRTCHIDTAALSVAEQWIADRRTTWESRLDRLGEFLDGQMGKPKGQRPQPTKGSKS
jgi:DNA-binding transcriptional ArsR family regulator